MGLFWLCTTLLLHLICVARLMPIIATITFPLLPNNHDFLWIILACCLLLSLLCFATLVAYYLIWKCSLWILDFVECSHKTFWIFCKNKVLWRKKKKKHMLKLEIFLCCCGERFVNLYNHNLFFVRSSFFWFSFFCGFCGMENFWEQFQKNFREVGIRLGATLTMTKAYPNFLVYLDIFCLVEGVSDDFSSFLFQLVVI
jgi:hypothetical protein